MKKYIIFLIIFIACWNIGWTQLTIQSGSVFHLKDNVSISLKNADLIINQPISGNTSGRFIFTGDGDNQISGSAAINFAELEINKSASGILSLGKDIGVNNKILFTQNNIDLNNFGITLDPSAILENENENSHIFGDAGGFVSITSSLTAPSSVNPGNLGAIITSAANMGTVTIQRGHEVQTISGKPSIKRFYDISPAGSGLNATLRFHFLNAELNGYDALDITIWQSADQVNWAELGRTGHDAVNKYVEKSAINSFYRQTLSELIALPLTWGQFSLKCRPHSVFLSWSTYQESNTKSFRIQGSSDRSNWTNLGAIAAAGNSRLTRNYTFESTGFEKMYRIVETDADGHEWYSPVLISKCIENTMVSIYPNPVINILNVTIPSTQKDKASLQLRDSKGAIVLRMEKVLSAGTNEFQIHVENLSSGVYSLTIESKQRSQETILVTKQ